MAIEAGTLADNNDYAVLNVATGDLASPIASPDTRAASLTLFSGSSAIDASRRLCLNVTKAGVGKVVGPCTIQIIYQVA